MAKKSEAPAVQGVPQFRVVVTRSNGRGPLGPYRLAVSVGFALLVAGGRIWSALNEGTGDDGALLLAGAAALFAWVITTVISNILGTVEPAATPPAGRPQGTSSGSNDPSRPSSLQGA